MQTLMKTRKIALLAAIFAGLLFGQALAEEDYYDWMPKGGRQLLFKALERCQGCEGIQDIVKLKKTQDEWKTYFQGKQGALATLTEKQVKTLTAYLAFNLPVKKEKIQQNPEKFDYSMLPPDGRILSLEACTLCHPIGPILTQEKDASGWVGLYGRPPHDEVEFSEQGMKTLTHYLVINTPMAMDEIPDEHKAELPGF